MKKVIISALAVASTCAANAQTVNNSDFELYTFDGSKEYSSEIVEGKELGLKELTSWKYENDISIFLEEAVKAEPTKEGGETGGKKADSSLKIGGAEVDGTNRAYTQIRIATAGLYTVTFESFTTKGLEKGAQAGVFLANSDATSIIGSRVFSEASDGAVTNQAFSFSIDKETIERHKGSFVLGFQNDGGKDSRSDVMVDSVAISSSVPEPSSAALLGLGALGLLVRRKR